jgi:hypothetical protein
MMVSPTLSSTSTTPRELLLTFFHNAKERLDEYNYTPTEVEEYIPIPIKDHQQFILKEQLDILNQVVTNYNDNNDDKVTVSSVQESLRLIGSGENGDNTFVHHDEEEERQTSKAMKDMNDAARSAFCRSILSSEYYWYQKQREIQDISAVGLEKTNASTNTPTNNVEVERAKLMMLDYNQVKRNLQRNNDDDSSIAMDRQTALEFCGLCTTAVKIPQVKSYIKNGHLDFDNDVYKNTVHTDDNALLSSTSSSSSSPEQRFSHLQQMILCALGYEPFHGSKEMQKLMINMNNNTNDSDGDGNNDDHLKEAFSTFLVTSQQTIKEIMEDNIEQQRQVLSDQDQGGVTRVVSVNYTQREVHLGGNTTTGNDSNPEAAPTNQRMEEQIEDKQREQLQMAQKAAQLQQNMLNQLLNMEEEERTIFLCDAKQEHENFMKEAISLPPMDRIAFMQNIDADMQKNLLMYKIWDSHHGGNNKK